MTHLFHALRDTDFSVLEANSLTWRKLSRDLEDHSSQLESTGRRQFSRTHFHGPAADSLRDSVRTKADSTDDASFEARTIAGIIEDAYEGFIKAQVEAERLYDVAARADLRIENDGTVIALDTGTSDPLAAQIQLNNRDNVQKLVNDLLKRAEECDTELHERLQSLHADDGERHVFDRGSALDLGLDELLAGNPTPEQVNDWWNSLSEEDREHYKDHRPEWVGGTDGIPVADRSDVNKELLDNEIADIEAELEGLQDPESSWWGLRTDDPDGDRREKLEQRLETLEKIQSQTSGQHPDTGQDYFLIDYDSANLGQAIVAVGNPDDADNVGVYVPGTESHPGKQSDYDRINELSADLDDAPGDSSMVLWLGYDAPQNIHNEARQLDYAEDGAATMSSFSEGLSASSSTEATNTTFIGHSYGSTAIGVAASTEGLATDNIVSLGSPGFGVDHASELGIDTENVYSTRAPSDIIQYARPGLPAAIGDAIGDATNLPTDFIPGGDIPLSEMIHGTDPMHPDFGGQTFTSDDPDPTDVPYTGFLPGEQTWVDPFEAHSVYFDEETASRDNMVAIISGLDHQVS